MGRRGGERRAECRAQQRRRTERRRRPADQVGNLVDDAKIVRTGSIELEVGDVPAALLTARDGIRAMGGYIGASQTQSPDDQPVATITYRIPVDRWEDALDLLRGIAGDATNV